MYFAGLSFSIVYDFLIRVKGIDTVWTDDILRLPFPNRMDASLRELTMDISLRLTCVTANYSDLWRCCALDTSEWNRARMLLSHRARHDALVKIDVLAAMGVGLDLADLKLIYSTQFPTLSENESDTWYDRRGRIVFTCSKGLPGVGLSPPRMERNQGHGMRHSRTQSDRRFLARRSPRAHYRIRSPLRPLRPRTRLRHGVAGV